MTPFESSSTDRPPIPARFEVLEELPSVSGRRVFRARDELLQREVLLKCAADGAHAPGAGGPAHESPLREARALARVHAPGVQRLLDVLETPQGALLVLEPCSGETLAARCAREGRLDASEVIDLALSLARSLEVVHAAGIMHRGISAERILLGEGGRVTLAGFELAKPVPAGGAGAPSTLRHALGSAAISHGVHLAPEQSVGGQDDPRSDLFALAWVLHECLTGAPPYTGTNPLVWTQPADASAAAPATPRALSRLLALCLAVSPAARPADATALRRALEALRAWSRSDAPAEGALARGRARPGPWTAVALASGALLLYLVAGGPLPGRAPTDGRGVEQVTEGLAARPADLRPAAASALEPRYARSYALLVGINYEGTGWPQLKNAEPDVVRLASALKAEDPSWVIETLVGNAATASAIRSRLCWLETRKQPNDRLLFYFAGHGVPSGAIVPVDGVAGEENRGSLLVMAEFTHCFRRFDPPKAKHILVALDCCYAGAVAASRGAEPSSAGALDPAVLRDFVTRRAHVLIAAGQADEQVSDDSPVGKALIAALAVGQPLTSSQLKVQIQALVRSTKQHPILEAWDDADSEFVFHLPGGR